MPVSDPQLYQNVVRITHVYLGPAADRFIGRQVRNHLHKTPDELSQDDLLMLIDWIRLAVSLITEDSDIIDEYCTQLMRLARPQTNSGLNPTLKSSFDKSGT